MHSISRVSVCVAFAVFGLFASSASFAGPQHVATIESECRTQLGLSAARCACFRETAETELSDKAQAFVAAQVTKDMGAAAQVQGTMSGDEMMAAMNFLTGAPQACP